MPDFDTGAHSQRFLSLRPAGQGGGNPGQARRRPQTPSRSASVEVPVRAGRHASALGYSTRSIYLPEVVEVRSSGPDVWIGAGEVWPELVLLVVSIIDKTAAVFVVLVYVVACTVGGLILRWCRAGHWGSRRCPRGCVGAVCRSRRGAALAGYYYCERMSSRLVGVIPY